MQPPSLQYLSFPQREETSMPIWCNCYHYTYIGYIYRIYIFLTFPFSVCDINNKIYFYARLPDQFFNQVKCVCFFFSPCYSISKSTLLLLLLLLLIFPLSLLSMFLSLKTYIIIIITITVSISILLIIIDITIFVRYCFLFSMLL